MQNLERVNAELAPLRAQLQDHEIYKNLSSVEDIKVFMEHHVFAVWDFMSLLKSLQQKLTTVQVPWHPAPNAKVARLINEIVFEEETDVNEHGEPTSHFEMYIDAMRQMGASTLGIDSFLDDIKNGATVANALENKNVPTELQSIVNHTFFTINSNKPHVIAASFTFGRENVIPDMFIKILEGANDAKNNYHKFIYYLQRHIELDADEHGPLALEMVSELCENDPVKWTEVIETAKESLTKRIELWDLIVSALKAKHRSEPIISF
jgi:hypothetical protein